MNAPAVKSPVPALAAAVAAALFLVLAGSGCTSTDPEKRSELPWNTPQSWESGGGMFTPQQGYNTP
ncbi:hypothetical protein [Kiritimatiella glycovorans]|uniref:Uncharacterized protein n=1 Tax=Kiritimatiella glycovorans TaxID=1307763 RepID=A0A0G3EAV9_9BACT|nr:hypothetical protein [Kiritimatiella glycovorans]AKJ63626.1 hypothetical protein L21SP4_00345 [Kiritimatiella glycovorans]